MLKYTILNVYYVLAVFTSTAGVGCACMEVLSWPTFAVDTSVPWSQCHLLQRNVASAHHHTYTTPYKPPNQEEKDSCWSICSLDRGPELKDGGQGCYTSYWGLMADVKSSGFSCMLWQLRDSALVHLSNPAFIKLTVSPHFPMHSLSSPWITRHTVHSGGQWQTLPCRYHLVEIQ